MRACHGWRKRGSALCIPTPCSPPGTCAFLSWQLSGAVGTAESSRNVYGWCTAVAMLEMLWLEKQVLLQWADVLNSSLLHFKFWLRLMARNSLGFWMWPLGLDTEAGVLKKPWSLSPEIPVSVCNLWAWQKHSDFSCSFRLKKKWTCCPELNMLVWQFCTTSLGLLESSTCDGNTFSTASVPALTNEFLAFFSLKW